MSTKQKAGFTGKLDREYLADFLSAPDALVDEAIFQITEDGLESRAIDPANVALVEASLDFDAFREAEGDEQKFAIDTYRLTPLVVGTEETDAALDFDPDTRKLDLGLGPYRYTHACMDPDSIRKEPTIPHMDLGFEARIKIDRLREAILWFDEFTTHVRIGYEPGDERFFIEGMERDHSGNVQTDDGVFELDRSELECVTQDGPANSHFSLDYFKDIVNAVPDGTTVTIRAGEEFPMVLSYEIAWEGDASEAGSAHGAVKFMQAPRIQS